MELTQLKQFQKVAEYNSLSRAAEALYISQPTLTRAMHNLEQELGVSLFDRKKNRIQLNDCGRRILEQVNRILEDVEQLKTTAASYKPEQQILNFHSSMPSSLRLFVRKYAEENPNSSTTIITRTIPDSAAEKTLLSRKADVVMCGNQIANHQISQILYCIFEMKLTVPRDNPLARKQNVRLSELEGMNFILPGGSCSLAKEKIIQELHQNFKNPHILVEEDFVNFTEMLHCSNYLAFTSPFSASYHDRSRALLSITDCDLSFSLYLSYLKDNTPKVNTFIQWMTTHYSTIMEHI